MNKHVLLLDHAHRFCLNIAAGFQCARSIFYHRPLAAAMFLILTGFVPSILPAGAASFLCGNYKNTLVEKYICANHEISQLDFQLGIINQQSLDVSEDKVAIQRQQHEWLTRKRDICRDEQCVKTAYTARIKELKIALYGRRPDILRWADPVNPVPIDPSDRPTLDLSGISIGTTTLSQPRGTQALLLDFGGGNSITYNGGFRDGGQIYQFAGDELNQQQIMQYLTTPVFLIGTGIADTIYGSNHNDNLYGHTGNETHPDNADHLYGQGGDDILEGGLGDDTLDGGEGNDRLLGQPGNDTLLGGLGDDRLFGNEGNDILDGGANNDYLEGSAGSDTYIFGRASGYDTLTEEESANMGSIDTIELDAGILPADVTISRDGWDLVLTLDQGPVQLRMRSFFETSTTHNKRIERVVFHDGPAGTVGTVWDAATIKAKTLSGTPNEQLSSLRRGVGLYRCGVIRPLTATLGVGVNFEIRDGIITEFNVVSSLSGSEFSQGYTNTCVKHLGEFGQSKDARGHILQLKTSDDQYGESLNCQVYIKDINSKFRVYSSKCLSECMKFDFEVSKTGKECYYEP